MKFTLRDLIIFIIYFNELLILYKKFIKYAIKIESLQNYLELQIKLLYAIDNITITIKFIL